MTTTDLNNNQQPPQGGQTPPPQGDPQGQQQQGQTPNTSQQTPPTNQNNQQQNNNTNANQYTSIDSLPPDIQDYIKRLRHENEEANKKAKAETQAKQQAEQERLKQQGEYKQLAEQHEAKVKELEPIATRYSDLAKLIGEQIETEIKDWPKVVKTLDPGTDAPVEQRLAWRNHARAIVTEIANTQRGQAPGNGQNPPAVGGNQQSQAGVDDLRQRLQAQRGNPF